MFLRCHKINPGTHFFANQLSKNDKSFNGNVKLNIDKHSTSSTWKRKKLESPKIEENVKEGKNMKILVLDKISLPVTN